MRDANLSDMFMRGPVREIREAEEAGGRVSGRVDLGHCKSELALPVQMIGGERPYRRQ